MSIIEQALAFEQQKMPLRSTDDRIHASRQLKTMILNLNEVYKVNKDQSIMDLMKRLTLLKKKAESRLKMHITI